jgi:hypothetical protein
MEITAEYLKEQIVRLTAQREEMVAETNRFAIETSQKLGTVDGAIAMAELMLQKLAAEEVPASPNGEVSQEPPGEAEVPVAAEGDFLDG